MNLQGQQENCPVSSQPQITDHLKNTYAVKDSLLTELAKEFTPEEQEITQTMTPTQSLVSRGFQSEDETIQGAVIGLRVARVAGKYLTMAGDRRTLA